MSEMYGVGSGANRAGKREQRRQGRREVEKKKKKKARARGGCKLIGAKWAADELKWFAVWLRRSLSRSLTVSSSLLIRLSFAIHVQ